MSRRRVEHLPNSIGALAASLRSGPPVVFHRHPRALLTSERLAACVGYDLQQVGRSLDLLTEAGLLERSQNPTHAARMYVLKAPESEWLLSLLEITSTREGRRDLIQAMRDLSLSADGLERDPRVRSRIGDC
jgi:hypothetical protein